jgi:hypothetical protein
VRGLGARRDDLPLLADDDVAARHRRRCRGLLHALQTAAQLAAQLAALVARALVARARARRRRSIAL